MPAHADTLAGPPVFIGAGLYANDATETSSNNIGLMYSDVSGEAIYYQVIANKITQKPRVTLFQATPALKASAAGLIPLSKGDMLVGYSNSQGLTTRVVYNDDFAGGETLLGSDSGASGGFLFQLADRGMAVLTTPVVDNRFIGFIRYVTKTGKALAISAKISRGLFLVSTPFKSGFIVKRYKPYRSPSRPGFVRAQIYGAEGKKVGPEKTLEEPPSSLDANFTNVYGLADGFIVVMRRTRTGSAAEVSAEVFNSEWELVEPRKVLAKITSSDGYELEPLPAGGFILAIQKGAKAEIEMRRYRSSLEPASTPLWISPQSGARISSIVAREQGDIFITYSSPNSSLPERPYLYGQFIAPD